MNSELEFLSAQQARLKALEINSTSRSSQQRAQHADSIHSFWERLRTNLGQWEAKLKELHNNDNAEFGDNYADKTPNITVDEPTTPQANANQRLLDLKLELQQLQKHCLGSVVIFEDWEVPVLPVADLRLLHNFFCKHLAQWETSKQEIAPKGKFVFGRYREEVARRKAAHQTISAAQSVTASTTTSTTSTSTARIGTTTTTTNSTGSKNEGAMLQDLSNVSVVIDVDGSVRVGTEILSLQISDAVLLVRNLKNCSLTM